MKIGYEKELDNFIKRKLKKILNIKNPYNLEKSEIEHKLGAFSHALAVSQA